MTSSSIVLILKSFKFSRYDIAVYFAPSFLGETIWIATWITGNDKRLRLRRRFQMVNAHTGTTLLRGLSDFVCINIESGKASRMPKEFVSAYKLTADIPGDQNT